jgi:hypothetical protein
MNTSKTDSFEFEPVAWSLGRAMPVSQSTPAHLTAQIMSPKPYCQYDGILMASNVRLGNAHYLILDLSTTLEPTDYVQGLTCKYQAFLSDCKFDPAYWRIVTHGDGPYLMCRAARLQGYQARPFWGWEVHHPTLGYGWYVNRDQNIERRLAPANQWAHEIECELLPRLQSRLQVLPSILERCYRLDGSRPDSNDKYIRQFYANKLPIQVTQHDLIRDNLVGMDEDHWRYEFPLRNLEVGIDKLQNDLPRLERRLVQAQWLIGALRPLKTQPIELERTMLRVERQYALPVPRTPLAIAMLNPVTPARRIPTSPGIRPNPKGMRIG